MTTQKNDLQLVNEVCTGQEGAFEELLNRYSSKVLNLALRVTRCQEDAEEVLQDVFVTVFKKVASFEQKSAFSSWLYRVALNTAFMKVRSRNRRKAISIEEISPRVRENWISSRSDDSDLDTITTRHELRGRIQEAIDILPEDYRAIFILRDVDGLSNQAVSSILRLSVPAVKSRLHRSRVILREKLMNYLDENFMHTGRMALGGELVM